VRRRWKRPRDGLDLAHLDSFGEGPTDGAVQRDEALLLYGLVRTVRPRTVVEIGFFRGDSALNFLGALDGEARLYSFDVDPECEAIARERFGDDPRLVYRTRSQDAITAEDIDGRLAELVFLDAAHDLALNQATFGRLLPLMAPDAILAVHDTGSVPRELFDLAPGHWMLASPELWVGDAWEHQPDERAFVNWLLETHPEFAQIHLHSSRTVRSGLTLLQRSAPLPRPVGAQSSSVR
jgi:predicted O-methyltransferase YrrM